MREASSERRDLTCSMNENLVANLLLNVTSIVIQCITSHHSSPGALL